MKCVIHDLARKGTTHAAFTFQSYSLCATCMQASAEHIHLGGTMPAILKDAIEFGQLP